MRWRRIVDTWEWFFLIDEAHRAVSNLAYLLGHLPTYLLDSMRSVEWDTDCFR